MQSGTAREIVLSGILIALGIVLPPVFHAFGAGSAFSPMHIPVLIAGFSLKLPFAIMTGFITPVLSSFITGMPPLFPVLPYMVFELSAYSAAACMLHRVTGKNIYVSLIISMMVGRIIAGIIVWLLVIFFNVKMPGPFAFICGSITGAIPGIIAQLAIIPGIVASLKKSKVI